jgi:hypothetical protein
LVLTVEEFSSLPAPPEVVALGRAEKVFARADATIAADNAVNKANAGSEANDAPDSRYIAFVILAVGALLLLGGLLGFATGAVSRGAAIICLLLSLLLVGAGLFTYLQAEQASATKEMPDIPVVATPEAVSGATATAEEFAYGLYPHALSYLHEGQWSVAHWDDVREFRPHDMGSTNAALELNDGRKLTLLREVAGASELIKQVELRTYMPLVARLGAAIEDGETVQFGDFSVNKKEIHFRGRPLAWKDIGKIEIHAPATLGNLTGGAQNRSIELRIQPTGGRSAPRFCAEPFLSIPNRAILLKMLRRYCPPGATMTVAPGIQAFMPTL